MRRQRLTTSLAPHAAWVSKGLALAGMVLTLASCSLPFGRPTPIAYREINLSGYCSQTDEDGFREQATLKV